MQIPSEPLHCTDHVLVPRSDWEALVTLRDRAEAKLAQLRGAIDPAGIEHVRVLMWLLGVY